MSLNSFVNRSDPPPVYIRSILAVAMLAAAAPAHAADVALPGGYYGAPRAGQIVFFDYEPGVLVRPYWLAPWRNVRFFPADNEAPKLGRRESFRNVPKPVRAIGYQRSWSSFPVDTIEQPPLVYAPQMITPAPKQTHDNEELKLK